MKFLFPKQPEFLNYFKELNECVKEISLHFDGFAKCFDNTEESWKKAKDIEHKADEINNKIIRELNDTFITPFDREDVYSLAQSMDEVIDLIENALRNMMIYQIKEKRTAIDEFSELILSASHNLDKLIEECFKKKIDNSNVNNWVIQIHDLEDKGDAVFAKSLKTLFSEEKDPIMIIKWKDVLEDLENIMDQFRWVSDDMVRVIVKSS